MEEVHPRACFIKRCLKSLKSPKTGALLRYCINCSFTPWAADRDCDVGVTRWAGDFNTSRSEKATFDWFSKSLSENRIRLCCCKCHFADIGITDDHEDDNDQDADQTSGNR